MHSSPVWGTNTKKTTLSWWDYWVDHVWMTGWWSIYETYINWMDLVWFEDNQQNYTLLDDDDPFEQCRDEFWHILGEDDTDSKEFLEYLLQMKHDYEIGKVKTVLMPDNILDILDD